MMMDDEMDMAAAMEGMDEGELDMAAAMGDDAEMDMAAAMGGAEPEASKAPPKTDEQKQQQAMLERFGDIPVTLDMVLGTAKMSVEQFLKLGRGAIVELDQRKDEDVTINANGKQVARGEININDDKISISVTKAAFKNKIYSIE